MARPGARISSGKSWRWEATHRAAVQGELVLKQRSQTSSEVCVFSEDIPRKNSSVLQPHYKVKSHTIDPNLQLSIDTLAFATDKTRLRITVYECLAVCSVLLLQKQVDFD